MTLHQFAFYCCMATLIVGAAIGLSAIWVPKYWQNKWGAKLIYTDGVLFLTSLAAAIITKLLA